MAFLARAGFDVFSVDMTGYGRSARPAPMNDPCNLAKDRQAGFVAAPCAPSYPHTLTSMASDWNDLDAAVDYIRTLRHVDRVPWWRGHAAVHAPAGTPLSIPTRSAGWSCLRLPTSGRRPPLHPPRTVADGVPMNTQSRQDFDANWDRQVGCADQYDRAYGECRVVGDARIGPGGRYVGPRRPARAGDLGHVDSVNGREADDAVPDDLGRTTSRWRRTVCASSTRTSDRQTRYSSTSRARPTTRCGSESPAAVPRVARVAVAGNGQRDEVRDVEARIRCAPRDTVAFDARYH